MPNLLKKKKGNSKISRFFGDLQTPTKRGGSLVVETGFPTSLIDLFVKNHDRFKKKKQPTTTIEEKEKEVVVCLASELKFEVTKNENRCVELDNKCYKVEGNHDGNERLDRGSSGNKGICLSGLMNKDENGCVELETKCYKVEGNDGNEILDRGSFGNKGICLIGLIGLCVLHSKGFVLWLSICALLLLLFEFVGKLNLFKSRWVIDLVFMRRDGGGCIRVGSEHEVELQIVNSIHDVIDCDVKCEIQQVIELKDECGMTRKSNFDSVDECGNVLCNREKGVENEGESCKMVDENGKTKKGNKLWRRCYFRGIISKKSKHSKQGKETHEQSCCIVSNSGEFDKVVQHQREEEEELINLEKCTSGIGTRLLLHRQSIRSKSSRMAVYGGLNVECIGVMVIALVGLIHSRMIGLVLTFICCVGFKFIRSF